MYNIFYVGNGLSLAIVLKHIKEQHLNSDKVILLLDRNLKNQSGYKSYDLTSLDYRTSWFFVKGWLKTIHVKKSIDTILSDNSISKFNFYTSSVSKLSTYFFINHINVNKITFIEEGRSSYYSEKEHEEYVKKHYYSNFTYPLYQVKALLNYFFLHYPNPNKSINFIKNNNNVLVYGNDSYKYVENRRVVKNPFIEDGICYNHIECLMSFSYPVEDGIITLDNYCSVLKDTFNYLIDNKILNIHYKFHPQQFNHPKNILRYKEIINSFSNRISFKELDRGDIIEVILANSNSILLSDYSSVMIYAKNFGNKILNNYYVIDKYKKTNSNMPLLPKALLNIIDNTKL